MDRLKFRAPQEPVRNAGSPSRTCSCIFCLFSLFGLFCLLCAMPAFAHGVGYKQADLRPLSLEFFYSTGEAMSYLEAKVYSPKDAEFAYQSGRTDEDGRFAFTPNVAGEWRVVVKDDEGHLAEAKIAVEQAFLDDASAGGEGGTSSMVVGKTAAPEGAELFVKGALGVSLLFNVAAFVSLARRRGRTV